MPLRTKVSQNSLTGACGFLSRRGIKQVIRRQSKAVTTRKEAPGVTLLSLLCSLLSLVFPQRAWERSRISDILLACIRLRWRFNLWDLALNDIALTGGQLAATLVNEAPQPKPKRVVKSKSTKRKHPEVALGVQPSAKRTNAEVSILEQPPDEQHDHLQELKAGTWNKEY